MSPLVVVKRASGHGCGAVTVDTASDETRDTYRSLSRSTPAMAPLRSIVEQRDYKMADDLTRRAFQRSLAVGSALVGLSATPAVAVSELPAILGGKPSRSTPFTSWPQIAANDEQSWMNKHSKQKTEMLIFMHAREIEKAKPSQE